MYFLFQYLNITTVGVFATLFLSYCLLLWRSRAGGKCQPGFKFYDAGMQDLYQSAVLIIECRRHQAPPACILRRCRHASQGEVVLYDLRINLVIVLKNSFLRSIFENYF
ncbi:unnamed protein product, partial [Vitis vinifera]|uniref:Uncharacterized protein n=1 Tax=Vitis vinifera TaxID=29760 RepID=E0CPE2_VITVI